jgi:hypothetical protein
MDETELPQGPPAGIDGSFHADVACQSSRDIALGQPEKPLRDLHIRVEHRMRKRDFDVGIHSFSPSLGAARFLLRRITRSWSRLSSWKTSQWPQNFCAMSFGLWLVSPQTLQVIELPSGAMV